MAMTTGPDRPGGRDGRRGAGTSLAEKLDYLLTHVPDPATGRRMSVTLLTEKLHDSGYQFTRGTLRNMWSGTVTSPQWPVVEGVARAFAVPTDFFRSDTSVDDWIQTWERDRARAERERLLEESGLGALATAAAGVSREGVELAVSVASVVLQRFARAEAEAARAAAEAAARAPIPRELSHRRRRSG